MQFMEWQEEWSVGVAALDAQHKVLVRLINLLHDIELHGGDMTGVFAELDRYVDEHFRLEEQMLEAAAYPDLAGHKGEHKVFRDWLRSVRRSYAGGGSSAYHLAGTVNGFLRMWLANHILGSDMAYRPSLLGQS